MGFYCSNGCVLIKRDSRKNTRTFHRGLNSLDRRRVPLRGSQYVLPKFHGCDVRACRCGRQGNVGLLFDTWHWYTCRSTTDDVRKLSVSDVVYVHINDAPAGIDPDEQIDNIRCLPAETGVIPLTELMQILTDIGYEIQPVTPEPFSQKVNGITRRCGESHCGITGSGVGKRRSVSILSTSCVSTTVCVII